MIIRFRADGVIDGMWSGVRFDSLASNMREVPEYTGRFRTADGILCAKWDGEKVVQRTQAEVEKDRANLPNPGQTDKERIAELEQKNLENEAALMELASIVAAQQEARNRV